MLMIVIINIKILLINNLIILDLNLILNKNKLLKIFNN